MWHTDEKKCATGFLFPNDEVPDLMSLSWPFDIQLPPSPPAPTCQVQLPMSERHSVECPPPLRVVVACFMSQPLCDGLWPPADACRSCETVDWFALCLIGSHSIMLPPETPPAEAVPYLGGTHFFMGKRWLIGPSASMSATCWYFSPTLLLTCFLSLPWQTIMWTKIWNQKWKIMLSQFLI